MKALLALLVGLVFGMGILIAGMGNPAKVLNFFDIAGAWDPSLGFVMAGGLGVAFLGYRAICGRSRPLLGEAFALPTAVQIDLKLIGGSALFGIGWGLSGFCPGGVVPVLGVGGLGPLVFFGGLLGGMFAAKMTEEVLAPAAGVGVDIEARG